MTQPLVNPSKSGLSEDIVHIVCCEPKRSMCGITDDDWVENEDGDMCIVCVELDASNSPCYAVDCMYRR